MPVEITMFPAGIVKYRAVVDGAPITRPTRQPFLDGARALPWAHVGAPDALCASGDQK